MAFGIKIFTDMFLQLCELNVNIKQLLTKTYINMFDLIKAFELN